MEGDTIEAGESSAIPRPWHMASRSSSRGRSLGHGHVYGWMHRSVVKTKDKRPAAACEVVL